jgi:hypothetical protein
MRASLLSASTVARRWASDHSRFAGLLPETADFAVDQLHGLSLGD